MQRIPNSTLQHCACTYTCELYTKKATRDCFRLAAQGFSILFKRLQAVKSILYTIYYVIRSE